MDLGDFHLDCRHFVGDRPCAPHKTTGVHCPGCPHYDRIDHRTLIVKLAAAGDVLRTTSILPPLRRRHPGSQVTWVTASGAVPLLRKNPLIDRVLPFAGALPVELVRESFDLVINLDAAPDSCAIASAAQAVERKGFGANAMGRAVPLHDEALPWYRMGLDDELKRRNTKSYPALLYEMLGYDDPVCPPSLHLEAVEVAFGAAFLERVGLASRRPVIGLNTGAGGRWELKKWTFEGYCRLIEKLLEQDAGIVLLGGPEERERNEAFAARFPDRVADAGTNNTLREFAGIVNALDLVVTGDTLAMHVAMAREVPTVVLFGPTSAAEIEVFARGEKIVAEELDCLCCYLMRCDKDPNCMNSISVDRVFDAVKRWSRSRVQTT
ncbi:MAG: glycosyltransferase family 9 protein [Planctomycetes bacterium]|nr:glycosyltransferase family 9 protein [Planctomycetota bacterium]